MTRGWITGVTSAATLGLLALTAGHLALEESVGSAGGALPVTAPSAGIGEPGLLYGRITTGDGGIYEGRLRWGGDEEALWSNYFNGFKRENPWAAHVPRERLPKERVSIEAFGRRIADWNLDVDQGRPFMARFGDIARIDPQGRTIRVTLKSGTVFDLDRFSADDLADGVGVWDRERGVVELREWGIRAIEFLPAPRSGPTVHPLHGTVHTRQGDFTGLIQWDREACLGTDDLHGRTVDGERWIRFETIRAIARHGSDRSLVTLLDGQEIVLSGTREVGRGNRGVYVDDPRYGRVLVSWDAFERVEFSLGGSAPAYSEFPPGRPLKGRVVTRSGRRLAGRLVYDLDESETTETLDAPFQGVDYTIPFSLIASLVPPGPDKGGPRHAQVVLRSGETLELEGTGDLGELNAGMLIFIDGRRRPEYVPWADVEEIEFDLSRGTDRHGPG